MSRPSLRAACLQLTPDNCLDGNLERIGALVAAAVDDGANLVALPEFATYLDRDSRSMRRSAATPEAGRALDRLCQCAAGHHVWLLLGSIAMLDEDEDDRLVNRSFLIAPDGRIAAHYDKIHLFDATLDDGRVIGESRHYRGGNKAVVADTPLGRIGLSICYDLRFPHLYRALAQAGAEIVVVPSAFTAQTGAAHWEPLLRARAIETGCYVLAPATTGEHPGHWHTHGHAAIISPWGEVLAECGREHDVFCSADLDLAACAGARGKIPSLATNPAFSLTTVSCHSA